MHHNHLREQYASLKALVKAATKKAARLDHEAAMCEVPDYALERRVRLAWQRVADAETRLRTFLEVRPLPSYDAENFGIADGWREVKGLCPYWSCDMDGCKGESCTAAQYWANPPQQD
jgi:hypothetical protein